MALVPEAILEKLEPMQFVGRRDEEEEIEDGENRGLTNFHV